MLAIAAGFVLRAVAGGAATGIGLSRWFMLVTSFGAIFVVAGKRHAELFGGARRPRARRHARDAAPLLAEPALRPCSPPPPLAPWPPTRCGRSAARSTAPGMRYDRPVVLWLGRYARLLVSRGAGEAPEELILRDRALLVLTPRGPRCSSGASMSAVESQSAAGTV